MAGTRTRTRTIWGFIVGGLAVALFLAFVVSPEASSSPDGLEKVSIDEGFDDTADDHGLAASPLADYGVDGVDNERLSTGLSGIIGVLLTFAVGYGVFAGLRALGRRSQNEPSPAPAPPPAPAPAEVGAGHAPVEALYVPGHSPLHRLHPETKVLATLLFALAVVSTPREAFWAFGIHATVVVTLALIAGLGLGLLTRRLVIELPFLAFALFLPLIGTGEQVEVAGLSLSVAGLWGAWNIVVKGTLGVAATAVMTATTPVTDILHGLDRLRVPKVFTAIAGFMIRYLDVIAGEARRMAVARASRGHDPRWIWQARALASSAGTLFIRSYERGERVHLAMLSRGYTGAMPTLDERAATRAEWVVVMLVPAFAGLVSATAWAAQ